MSEIFPATPEDDELYDKRLNELDFKDFYIRIDDGANCDTESRYNPTPGTFKSVNGIDEPCLVVPEEYKNDIQTMRLALRKVKKSDTGFRFAHNGIRYRGCEMKTVTKDMEREDETWVCLRRFQDRMPDIDVLRYSEAHRKTLKKFNDEKGIIIICGGTGAGKTTTGIALYRYCAKSRGGVCYMVEDPCEYIMQGAYDDNPDFAMVLQREVQEDKDWPQAIKDGLRANPKFVYLGELRSPKSAEQALRMAASGHLVICTVHGSSIEQGLSSVIHIAKSEMGDLAYQMLADSLVAIIYQEMVRGKVEMDIMEAGPMSSAVRDAIRSGEMKRLADPIAQQKAKQNRDAGIANVRPPGSNAPRSAQKSSGNGHGGGGGGKPPARKKKQASFWDRLMGR